MRISNRIEYLKSYQEKYQQIIDMPVGSSIILFGYKITRVGNGIDNTLSEWTKLYIKEIGAEVLYDIFKTQIITGYGADGEIFGLYADSTKKKKQYKFDTIFSNIKYKDIFGTPNRNVYNLFDSGDSIRSISGSKITIGEPFSIYFDYTKTLFVNKKVNGKELFRNGSKNFGLNNKSLNYFITKFLVPFVYGKGGDIKEFKNV